MSLNRKQLRLVWKDQGALERHAVHLACHGSTEELKQFLALLERRGTLKPVASDTKCKSMQTDVNADTNLPTDIEE
jgi:hypothetical protein